MSTSLSPADIRAQYMAAMGPELGELVATLSAELIWTFWRWQQFLDLFADRTTRIDLMNRAAPFFFGVIQDVLWDDVLLSISWLTGPPRSAGRPNLTLMRLSPLISDGVLRTQTESGVANLASAAAFAVDRRNRRIAHRDLDLSLGRLARPLAAGTQQEVDEILDGAADVLNGISAHYNLGQTAYRMGSVPHGATDLLSAIRDGLRRRDVREERLQTGDIRPEDWDDDAPPI